MISNVLLPLGTKRSRGGGSWYNYRGLQSYLTKKMFLEILRNSQENTCVNLFFNEVAGLKSATLLKKETPTQVFYCEFWKLLRKPFLQYICWRHLLIFLRKEYMVQHSEIPRLLLSVLLFFLTFQLLDFLVWSHLLFTGHFSRPVIELCYSEIWLRKITNFIKAVTLLNQEIFMVATNFPFRKNWYLRNLLHRVHLEELIKGKKVFGTLCESLLDVKQFNSNLPSALAFGNWQMPPRFLKSCIFAKKEPIMSREITNKNFRSAF